VFPRTRYTGNPLSENYSSRLGDEALRAAVLEAANHNNLVVNNASGLGFSEMRFD
jgi:hypothetical protein